MLRQRNTVKEFLDTNTWNPGWSCFRGKKDVPNEKNLFQE